jgi:hypothetical protein
MKRYVSGLSKADLAQDHGVPDGVFLVQVERSDIAMPGRPISLFCFSCLNQKTSEAGGSPHGFTPPPKPT